MPIRMKKRHFILTAFLCSTYLFLSAQTNTKTDKDTTTAVLHQFDDVVIIGTLEKKEVIPVQTLSGEALKKLNVYSVADAVRYFSGVQVKDYGGIGGLKTVNGNLSIKGLYVAKDLDMSSLTTVTSTFTFYGATSRSYASRSTITNLDTFYALTSAKKVDIRYAGALVDYSGLKNVIPSLSSSSSWKVSDCAYNPSYDDMLNGRYTNN